MASLDFLALGTPVSEEAACGPDLDLEGDADYMNFVARAEGVLPTTFFSGPDGKPFDRSSIDFNAEFDAIAPLLQRTRDLRLLVILAKLLLLNRDIAGFVRCIELIAALVKERWDEVHPQGMDGDFGIRMAALEFARRHAAGHLSTAVFAAHGPSQAWAGDVPQLDDRDR